MVPKAETTVGSQSSRFAMFAAPGPGHRKDANGHLTGEEKAKPEEIRDRGCHRGLGRWEHGGFRRLRGLGRDAEQRRKSGRNWFPMS